MNNSFHKKINTLARVLGYFVMVMIICGIFSAVVNFADSIFNKKDMNNEPASQIEALQPIESNGVKLKLDLKATNVKIVSGEKFSYSTNNDYITVSQTSDRISITEQSHKAGKVSELEIILPENATFSEISIDGGAGNFEIDRIAANIIDFDLGAGNFTVNSMNADVSADIEAGAGSVTIKGGSLSNVDFDCGVGNVRVTAALKGKCSFDCAVGEVDICAIGKAEDYTVRVSKGLGRVTVESQECRDGDIVGSGANEIKISGGIGEIKTSFTE